MENSVSHRRKIHTLVSSKNTNLFISILKSGMCKFKKTAGLESEYGEIHFYVRDCMCVGGRGR